jgi:hypothetical protein
MIITILRKPLDGSVADNTLKHGCGAINIDATRVGTEARSYRGMGNKVGNQENASGSSIYWMSKPPTTKSMREGASGDVVYEVEGRWPANFILTHLEGYTSHGEDWACVEGCSVKGLDQQSGHLKSGEMNADKYQQWGKNGIYGEGKEYPAIYYGDEGGASRFFKQFKKDNDQ